jgi:hypothetical protein
MNMKTFDFVVTVASDNLDIEVIEDTLRASLVDSLPENVPSLVKFSGVKEYSEQGWKVARNRKFGISVEQAGDGVSKAKAKSEIADATA